MTDEDLEAAKVWVKDLIRRQRFEFGCAMAMAGLNPDLIIEIQRDVAEGMWKWLQQ